MADITIRPADTKSIIIKQSIDILVSYFQGLHHLGKLDQWTSYLLESIEEEIGFDEMKEIGQLIDARIRAGRW